MGYIPRPPALHHVLAVAAKYGRVPTFAELTAARASIEQYHINYVLISGQQPNAERATLLVQQITGCTPQIVSDLTVCAIPRQPRGQQHSAGPAVRTVPTARTTEPEGWRLFDLAG